MSARTRDDPSDPGAVLLAGPDMSHLDTELASAAVTAAARAMDRALHGPEARPPWRWRLVASAAALRDPGPARLLEARGLHRCAARTLARRIAPLIDAAPLATLDPRRPVGLADARGVPESERTVLVNLGPLAVEAARGLRTPAPVPGLDVAALVEPDDDPGAGPWAGMLAARLDHPDLPERAVRGALAADRARFLAEHPGTGDWLPPGAASTVVLRSPAAHPGLPLAFAPFAVACAAALRALNAKAGPA